MKSFKGIVIGSVGGAYNFTDYEIQISIPHKINEEVSISCNKMYKKRVIRKNGTKSVFNIFCTSKCTETNVVYYLKNHVQIIKK